jgi:hypothetical protein
MEIEMRSESWMDYSPPKPDPIKQARMNLSHWAERCRALEAQLDSALAERVKASEELDRLEGVGR